MTPPECRSVATELAAAFPLREIEFSEEIQLRPLRDDDLPVLTEILGGDPAMSWTRNTWTVENVRYLLGLRLAHYSAHQFGMYGVIEKASGALIGMAGLQFWDEASCDIEVISYIRRSDWNRGLATSINQWCCARAFSECPSVTRIVAATRHDNVAAQAVARHLGMTISGEGEHYGAQSLFWTVDRTRFAEIATQPPG